MNAKEIIERIEEETTDKAAILAALQDGAYLASIGVAAADQEAIEEAYSIVKGRV